MMDKVIINVKDYSDNTNKILNQIFSSIKINDANNKQTIKKIAITSTARMSDKDKDKKGREK